MILNAAPNREGRLAPNIVATLEEIGKLWKHGGPAPKIDPAIVITTPNLATGQTIHANASPDTVGPDQANDGEFGSSWHFPENLTSGWLEITFKRPTEFNTLVLVEPVGRWDDYRRSRIKSYRFQRWEGSAWVDVAQGATPSRVQMHAVPKTRTTKLRLTIEADLVAGNGDTPHIAEIGVYNEPRL